MREFFKDDEGWNEKAIVDSADNEVVLIKGKVFTREVLLIACSGAGGDLQTVQSLEFWLRKESVFVCFEQEMEYNGKY